MRSCAALYKPPAKRPLQCAKPGFVHCGPRLEGTLYTGTCRHCTNPLQNGPSSAQSPSRRFQVPSQVPSVSHALRGPTQSAEEPPYGTSHGTSRAGHSIMRGPFAMYRKGTSPKSRAQTPAHVTVHLHIGTVRPKLTTFSCTFERKGL